MTRAEYILAHAPTLLAGLIASGRKVNEDTVEAMAEAAGKLWDLGEPLRQTRSVKDEVGYRTAVEDCYGMLMERAEALLQFDGGKERGAELREQSLRIKATFGR